MYVHTEETNIMTNMITNLTCSSFFMSFMNGSNTGSIPYFVINGTLVTATTCIDLNFDRKYGDRFPT